MGNDITYNQCYHGTLGYHGSTFNILMRTAAGRSRGHDAGHATLLEGGDVESLLRIQGGLGSGIAMIYRFINI